ncbi:hypothetical protein GCM10027456_54670 [Kineosporia babensis]
MHLHRIAAGRQHLREITQIPRAMAAPIGWPYAVPRWRSRRYDYIQVNNAERDDMTGCSREGCYTTVFVRGPQPRERAMVA